mgnify:CR=1 FL=1
MLFMCVDLVTIGSDTGGDDMDVAITRVVVSIYE